MINLSEQLIETPWDSRALGIPTFEIRNVSSEVLEGIKVLKGHFTVKVDPLSSKQILFDHGFYYCDTLIKPFCSPGSFVGFEDMAVKVTRSVMLEELLMMAHGAFIHGRFHRDFKIRKDFADLRYDLWLKDLFSSGNVIAMTYSDKPAAFIGFTENKIVLNAVSDRFRGKGLAKFLWSAGCAELFSRGYDEIESSISASNMAAVNLYASLGFRFRTPLDVYHRLNIDGSEK